MSRTLSPLPALLALGICAVWIASCNEDTSQRCTPGTTRLCAGIGACAGVQRCLEDGSDYAECDCSSGPREKPMGEEPTTAGIYVGRACTADAECGAGLTCIQSDSNAFFGGGPAGGYCTLPCQTDAQCAEVDRQSSCFPGAGGDTGLCVRNCLSLSPRSLAENKCLGRRDVVCQSVAYLGIEEFSATRQAGWCVPQCGSDEDCGDRFCDLGRGVCTDTPAAGAPIGARCETGAECAGGTCIRVGDSDRFCSAPCVFGQPVGCGYGPSATLRDAACVLPRVQGFTSAEGAGDVGTCFELCDVDADCEQAAERGWACNVVARFEEDFGRAGFCFVPEPADAGAGDAAADAADASDAGATLDASTSSDGG